MESMPSTLHKTTSYTILPTWDNLYALKKIIIYSKDLNNIDFFKFYQTFPKNVFQNK